MFGFGIRQIGGMVAALVAIPQLCFAQDMDEVPDSAPSEVNSNESELMQGDVVADEFSGAENARSDDERCNAAFTYAPSHLYRS